MTLDPRDRKSWQGLFELFLPPADYRLTAALGTSFGLSLDALVAALLAMSEADPDTLSNEPVAGVLAATRLRAKARVLVHPGTIAGSSMAGSNRFVALLDRMILEVTPRAGLFHPKVWAVRFDLMEPHRSSKPKSCARLVVSSRNLAPSSAFELGTILEGQPAADRDELTPFSVDVADALAAWLKAARGVVPKNVRELPAFIRGLALEVPKEARDGLRLRWQGLGRPPLATLLPPRMRRALIVSPFVQPDFVSAIASRTNQLQLISMKDGLDGLDETTITHLEDLGHASKTAAMYYATNLQNGYEDAIDGIHAKLVLTEDQHGATSTFVGSANATGPGWGFSTPPNVEAVVEMRPGISIDAFTTAFVRESKAKVHPWIVEYDRDDRTEPDSDLETERNLLSALRQAAILDFTLTYDAAAQRLRLAVGSTGRATWLDQPGCTFTVAPLLLTEHGDAWTPLQTLASTPREFESVTIEKVTAFVAIRARNEQPPLERTRLALARLHMSEPELDERDAAVRREIMATADPAAVLSALVQGLAHLRRSAGGREERAPGASQTVTHLFAHTGLEQLLQAVALHHDLVDDLRLVLGCGDGPLQRLCEELEHVVRIVRSEVPS